MNSEYTEPRGSSADTLSHANNDLVLMHYPNAHLIKFTPPQLKSGSANSVVL